jgi:hypothetical protein
MPFDGAEFFREPVCPTSKRTGWYSCFAVALRHVRRIRLFRSSPEPIDAAVLRVLEEARGLIEQREDWTQGTFRNVSRRTVRCGGTSACDWLPELPNGRSNRARTTSAYRHRAWVRQHRDGATWSSVPRCRSILTYGSAS